MFGFCEGFVVACEVGLGRFMVLGLVVTGADLKDF